MMLLFNLAGSMGFPGEALQYLKHEQGRLLYIFNSFLFKVYKIGFWFFIFGQLGPSLISASVREGGILDFSP